jgi:ribonuclease P protein component
VSETPQGEFPKSAHLRKHADFRKVYELGRRHFSGNMTVFYLRRQADADATPLGAGEASRLIARDDKDEDASRLRARKDPGPVRSGFTVRRALGGSVERNRMRRRTREAVRHHLQALAGLPVALDVVINPKKSLLKAEFTAISEEIERAFRVISQNVNRQGSAQKSFERKSGGRPSSAGAAGAGA